MNLQLFLHYKKFRFPIMQSALRQDAHSIEDETIATQTCSEREFLKRNSLLLKSSVILLFMNPKTDHLWSKGWFLHLRLSFAPVP